MAKADRLERLDARRIALEQEYEATLVAALERCAGGHWGLFAHNPKDRAARASVEAVVAELTETGADIDDMRETLGIERFALHGEFIKSRGTVGPQAVGEPKQAQAWLAQMRLAAPDSDA